MSWVAWTGFLFHVAAAAIFTVLYCCARPNSDASSVAQSAFVVSVVTATVNFLQLGLQSNALRFYTLTWGGFAFSLFLIGHSLATFMGHDSSRRVFLGFTLALVGALGTLGIYASTSPGIYAVIVGAFLLYAAFFTVLVRERGASAPEHACWVLVLFGAATLAYIIPYIAGFPTNASTVNVADTVWYLVGNVVTKIAVPVIEWAMLRSDAAGSDALVVDEGDTELLEGSSSSPYRLHWRTKRK